MKQLIALGERAKVGVRGLKQLIALGIPSAPFCRERREWSVHACAILNSGSGSNQVIFMARAMR
jgi:hypothetical protein